MKNKNNNLSLALGIIFLVIAGIYLMNNSNLFAVGQQDLINTGTQSLVYISQNQSYENFINIAIVNNSFSFKLNNQLQTFNSAKNFWMADNSFTMYDAFPELDGTHTIKYYEMTVIPGNQSQLLIKKFEKTYDVLVKTIYQNITIANQTFYVNVPFNVTINNTVYVNKTVEKIITIEPDLNAWFKKYQIYILAIGGLGLVYYLTRKKK